MAPKAQRAPTRPYRGMTAEERVAQRRERLLHAGLQVYGSVGYTAAGVKDVCREAGLTDRYFYESFNDSAELLTAIFDRQTSQLLEVVQAAVATAPRDPEAQARAAIEGFVRALADNPGATRVIFVDSTAAGAEVERHVRARLRDFSRVVAATARPYFSTSVSDRLLEIGALSLVGAIERVMIEWADGGLEATVDELVAHFVELFLAAGASAGKGWSGSQR